MRAGTLAGVTAISAGVNNTCAVAHGRVYCWGTDDQSGAGVIVNSKQPELIKDSKDVIKIANGRNFFCSLLADGHVICFGSNIMMQLGAPETERNYTFASPEGIADVTGIGAGLYGACALLATGQVYCWGVDFAVTEPEFEGSPPHLVRGLGKATRLSVGADSACVALETGGAQCWGNNDASQLGNGERSKEPPAAPVDVMGLPGMILPT